MSYNLKILIVFDTNSLRSTEEDAVAYSFFAFGEPFQKIEEFITKNGLLDQVHLAVPQWVIEELKDQKKKQYTKDVDEYQKLAKRLSGLPHTGEITFPDTDFDCAVYVEENAKKFMASKQIHLLELKEDIANTVLQSMMIRVMKDHGVKAPFAHSGKYKDAGFKDNLVWESLMNFDKVEEYDKIIFICKDGDFNKHCEDEFSDKWKRHIAIEKNWQNVVTELEKDYKNYIENRIVYDFADKEYFQDYLNDILRELTYIQLEEEHKVENYKVVSYCKEVEKAKDMDGDFESPIIISEIQVFITRNGKKETILVHGDTMLSDYETLGIEGTSFEPEVY